MQEHAAVCLPSQSSPYAGHYRFPLNYDLQWLRDEFLVYLDEWEKSVNDRPGFSKEEKNLMLLSPATRLGIRMTGDHSFFPSNVTDRAIKNS